MTVKVLPIAGVAPQGAFQGQYSNVNAGSDGTFTIDPRDLAYALGAGYVPARTDFEFYYTPTAPAAASAGLCFASAALSNGTKAIAANVQTSKGVARMRSQVVTGLTGGSSPTFYIGTSADLSVPVPPGAQDAVVVNEWLDGAIVAVVNAGTLNAAGKYTANTAPNATHNFGVSYTTLAQ